MAERNSMALSEHPEQFLGIKFLELCETFERYSPLKQPLSFHFHYMSSRYINEAYLNISVTNLCYKVTKV